MNKDLRIAKTEELIQNSFIFLLQQNSIEKLTVKEICTFAKIGRSTFYAHYTDKFDLLEQTINFYSELFDNLVQNRFYASDISESIGRIAKEMNKMKVEINTLFCSSYNQYNLKKNFQSILETHCESYIKKVGKYKTFSLPQNFLIKLYASNAMTVIDYSLDNELSKDISSFMNALFENTLKQI